MNRQSLLSCFFRSKNIANSISFSSTRVKYFQQINNHLHISNKTVLLFKLKGINYIFIYISLQFSITYFDLVLFLIHHPFLVFILISQTMPISLLIKNTHWYILLIVLQLRIVAELIPTATTEVVFLKITIISQNLEVLLQYLFLIRTTMNHQTVSRTVTVDSMKHIVVFRKFSMAIVTMTVAIFMMRMVATTAFHTSMYPFLSNFIYKFNLAFIILMTDRFVPLQLTHTLQSIEIRQSTLIGLWNITRLQKMNE